MKRLSTVFAVVALNALTPAQGEGLHLQGRILDTDGAPLSGARVSIATAQVRHGFSPY